MERYIARHHLEKKDATAAAADAVEPIVYYVDPGAPADVRARMRHLAAHQVGHTLDLEYH